MFDEKEGSISQTFRLFDLCIVEHARATVWRRLRTQRDNEENRQSEEFVDAIRFVMGYAGKLKPFSQRCLCY